jgi:hypothetical protein
MPDDLLFRETTWLHVHSPAGDGLYPFLEEIPGLRSTNCPRFKLEAVGLIKERGVAY